MSVSFWNDESLSAANKEFDIVIIGAGIAGVSTAYWLGKLDPNLKIAVLDKGELGSGATGRNAGFITCGSVEHFSRMEKKYGIDKALSIWRFSEENLELLKNELLGESSLIEQTGSFSLASTESEYQELQNSFNMMKSNCLDVELITKPEIETRLNATGFCGGIKYLKDACTHPIKLLYAIKSRWSENISLLQNHEVYKIESDRVFTSKSKIKSEISIMATNGYSYLLEDFFKDKIYPTRGQILATKPVPLFLEAPCYANFVLDYFRQ
jgi:glycine/D-amino acid oxidase-like deaminating enzyme